MQNILLLHTLHWIHAKWGVLLCLSLSFKYHFSCTLCLSTFKGHHSFAALLSMFWHVATSHFLSIYPGTEIDFLCSAIMREDGSVREHLTVSHVFKLFTQYMHLTLSNTTGISAIHNSLDNHIGWKEHFLIPRSVTSGLKWLIKYDTLCSTVLPSTPVQVCL